MVKSFSSAPKEERPDYPGLTPLPFRLPGDDHVYKATPPKRAIWQRVNLANRANVDAERRAATLVDYLRGTLAVPGDLERLEHRLLHPGDSLDLADLWQVITWLSEIWTYQIKHPGQMPPGEEDVLEGELAGEVGIEAPAAPVVIEGEPAVAEPVAVPALPPVPPANPATAVAPA